MELHVYLNIVHSSFASKPDTVDIRQPSFRKKLETLDTGRSSIWSKPDTLDTAVGLVCLQIGLRTVDLIGLVGTIHNAVTDLAGLNTPTWREYSVDIDTLNACYQQLSFFTKNS